MKCPNYIKELLRKRVHYAVCLGMVDRKITDYIEKHHIDVESCDYCGGIEMYSNPSESAQRVQEAIEKS